MRPSTLVRLGMAAVVVILSGCGTDSPSHPHTSAGVRAPSGQASVATGVRLASRASAQVATLASSLRAIDVHMRMITTRTGLLWGYRANRFVMYETADGGHTWKSVPLPTLPTDDVSAYGPGGAHDVAAVIDSSTMWSLVSVSRQAARVWITKDAGRHWRETTLALPAGAIQFAAGQWMAGRLGWMLFESAGYGGVAAKYLYRTENGGNSWQLVATSTGDLPHNGVRTAMSFAPNGKTGLMVVVDDLEKEVDVVETNDGGLHWQPTSISLPSGITQPPSVELVLAGPGEALQLAIEVQVGSASQLLVMNSSYGSNWDVAEIGVDNLEAMCASPAGDLAALEDKSGQQTWMVSPDSGQTWYTQTAVGLPASVADAASVDLSSPSPNAFFLVALDARLSPTLYESSDAGDTWQPLG
ncbi:WD40/YVTN/BNR-like repeat-containing protein [Alicyclobacillus acidocaldarius]|uniref:WD40/YVTN/BNR-like repeat-containing protein n=1 Tax=Alicyclobacillus acidocaldarius TaxID=405212 RepID=UPI0005A0C6C9|nr:sialidase family protein [Alicyclobacillus acidocaldarius]